MQSKTQKKFQMVLLCNMQHSVIHNYIFRPCKWAIIRLFVEPEGWLYNGILGDEISSYIMSCGGV